MEIIKTNIEGVVIIEAGVRRESRQDTVCAGQREHVELWRDARPALPATTLYAEQAGALRERCGTGRGGGHPQGKPDVRAACGRGADGGQPPAVLHSAGLRTRVCRAERDGGVPVQV